jgi:hypothetical protein
MKTLLCTLMLAAFSAAAKADEITITFDQPNQAGSEGQTIQFFGTITNNTSGTVFLNSDDLNLGGLSLATNDLFFANAPISLGPDSNSGDIELFDVTVSNPLIDPAATYLGSYDLVGGPDGNAADVLGSASFSVTTTPEPSAIYLLLSVIAATAFVGSRRRRPVGGLK